MASVMYWLHVGVYRQFDPRNGEIPHWYTFTSASNIPESNFMNRCNV